MRAALQLGCCIAPIGRALAYCLLLCCCIALPCPLYPRRSNGPAPVAVANAKALQLPLPPMPGWPVSPVLWVLRHAVGHLRQPWDPRDRAMQEPPVGARCPVTPDGMISGYDYDYDYIHACVYIYIYIYIYVCVYIYKYTCIYPLIYTPLRTSRWLHTMALRYVEGYKVPKVSESKRAENWLISIVCASQMVQDHFWKNRFLTHS